MAVVTVHIDCGQPLTTIARDDSAIVFEPGPAIPCVFANDSYTGSFTLTHSAIPPELDFNTTTGAVTLLPGAPYGGYTFTYTLCANGQCDTATVTVERRPKEFSRCDVYERAFFSSC